MSANTECLLAREVHVADGPADDIEATLTHMIGSLKIDAKDSLSKDAIQPADFVTLQSIRSSALARKTNTTSKFSRGGKALYDDLLNVQEDVKDSKKEEEQDSGRESEEGEDKKEESTEQKKEDEASVDKCEDEGEQVGDLISRGPVRTSRPTHQPHPYQTTNRSTPQNQFSAGDDYNAYSVYGAGYECGVNTWNDSPSYRSMSSTSPATTIQSVASPMHAASTSPGSPFTDASMSSAELNRLLTTSSETLPDPLVDFILSYSRQYGRDDDRSPVHTVHTQRPPSTDLLYADSPPSDVHSSPGAPHSGFTGRITPPGGVNTLTERPARLRLRADIQSQLDGALLWLCKCIQVAPGALTYQDPDQDSLLHIVLQHNDVPKAYAVVEQQLKLDWSRGVAPFDLKNRNGETPLMVAVQRRNKMVVEYLLEAGANPNCQPIRGTRDGPLHHAATRGMTSIVESLVKDKRTQVNRSNGLGQSALHSAVRHHGAFDEESKTYVNNFDVMKVLLDAGADPLQVCSTDGKTVLHYAVEKCDATIIDHLRKVMSEEAMTELANKADFNHEVPIDVLEMYKDKIDESVHSTVFFALLTCGASVGKSHGASSVTDYSPRSDQ